MQPALTSSPPAPRTWAGHGLSIVVTVHHTMQAALQLTGDLDLASAPVLSACLENQLDTGRRYGRLDLSAVSFIDAAGLSAIIRAHHAYLAQRGMLILSALSPTVLRLLQVLGTDRELLIAREPEATRQGEQREATFGRQLHIVD